MNLLSVILCAAEHLLAVFFFHCGNLVIHIHSQDHLNYVDMKINNTPPTTVGGLSAL